MDTKFLNSDNSKTSDPQRLLFDLSDTMNLKISDKYLALSNLIKSHKKQSIRNISSDMGWRVWITWWIIFCIR